MIDRNLKLWVGACVALGLAMAACGMRPGTLPADADPAAWRLMAAAGAALAAFAVVVGSAVAVAGRHLLQEIGLVAEQAEAVLRLPDDVKVAGARELGKRAVERDEGDEEGEEYGNAHVLGWGTNDGSCSTPLAAEM